MNEFSLNSKNPIFGQFFQLLEVKKCFSKKFGYHEQLHKGF